MAGIRTHLKKVFGCHGCPAARVQILDNQPVACGLTFGFALTWNQNPVFQTGSGRERPMGRRPGRGLGGWALVLAGVLAAWGCASIKPEVSPPVDGPAPAAVPAAPAASPSPAASAPAALDTAVVRQRRFALHAVRWPEENLALIARWYTGKADHWKAIAQATPNLRGRALAPGDLVFIPEELIRRREALPRSFVLPKRPAAKPAATPPARVPSAPAPSLPDPEPLESQAPTAPPPADDPRPRPFGPRTYPTPPAP